MKQKINYRAIDRRIRFLVRAMNDVPFIETKVSCEGHFCGTDHCYYSPAYVVFSLNRYDSKPKEIDNLFYRLLDERAHEQGKFFVELRSDYERDARRLRDVHTLEISTGGAGPADVFARYPAPDGFVRSNEGKGWIHKSCIDSKGRVNSPIVLVHDDGRKQKPEVNLKPAGIRTRLDKGIAYCTKVFRDYRRSLK